MLKRLVATLLVLLPLAASAIELTTPVLAPAAYSLGGAAIASNGRTFLRLFQMNGQTYASVADADGRTTTQKPALVGNVPIARLVWTGSDYAGVTNAGSLVRLLRFAEDGSLLADSVLPFTMSNIKLASNGSNLLLTGISAASGRLQGHLLTREGALLSDLGPLAPSGLGSYAVTSSGGDYILAIGTSTGLTIERLRRGTIESIYTDSRPLSAVFDIAARPDSVLIIAVPQGVSALPELDVIANNSLVRLDNLLTSTRVITTASGYAVLRRVGAFSGSDIERYGPNGQRLDVSALQVIPGSFMDAAAVGDLVQILANDLGAVAGKLTATTVDTNTPLVMPLKEVVSILSKRQIRPAAASDGTRFLGAFTELTADSSVASFARFTRTGSLDRSGIALGDSAYFNGPTIVTAPGGYLAVWSTSQELRGAFITSGGVAGTPFLVAPTWEAADAALAWNGTSFLAVWSMNGRIYGTTIFPTGSVGVVQRISPDPGPYSPDYYLTPDVAWDGTHFVVDWLVYRHPGGCVMPCFLLAANAILIEHVSVDGRPVGPQPLAAITNSERPINHAQIASAGNGTALLTIDRSNRLEIAVVRGASVDPPRALFDWLGVLSLRSDIAFDGSSYVIGWRFGDPWRSFIATAHIAASGSGAPFESRAAVIGPGEPSASPYAIPITESFDVALATVSPEESAVVVSEVATPGDSPRVNAYFTTEMPVMPLPPAAPHDVAAVYRDGVLEVTWAAGTDAQGFAIQNAGNGVLLGVAPAGATRATISPLFRGAVQVRAYNGGGIGNLSAAAPVVVYPTRRRAAKKG